VSLLLAWPAGVALAAAAGAALAIVALRLREDYLAIVTLGFAEVLRLFLLNEAWLTRGANGVTAIPRPLHAWFPSQYHLFYLILVLAALGLVYAALERVRRSPFGRVLRAIREDEVVAAVAGKPIFRFKVQRSEEHTSELQSRGHLVCRLLLEKKKKSNNRIDNTTAHASNM